MSLLVRTGFWRNLKDQKCHYSQLEVVLAIEFETNLEVDYKEWFCWEPRMLVLDLQQKMLGWEFRGQKLQKMGLERHYGVKGLVQFGRTKFENSYNVCE